MFRLSLNGDWLVRENGAGPEIPARVPGCIHTDLLRQDLIPDPLYRDNESKELPWVSERDWVYERTFEVDAHLLENERLVLRCEGLDTLASISVNSTEVGRAATN